MRLALVVLAFVGSCAQAPEHDHAFFERDLLDSLRSGSEERRIEAASTLAEGDVSPRALDALAVALSDSAIRVRVAAAQTLARFDDARSRDPGVIAMLTAALWHADIDVRIGALRALAALGRHARSAAPELERALRDTTSHDRDEVRTALRAVRADR